MSNGDASGAIGAAVMLFLKEKLTMILWTLIISAFGLFGSYKVIGYRVEQQATEIASIRATMAIKADEDRKEQEIVAEIGRMRLDVIATIRSESEDRKVNDQQIAQEVRRANERIDILLNELRRQARQ